MYKYLKIITILSLITSLGITFAEGTDWIAFNDENIKIYPIIFGKLQEPPDGLTINCQNNFSSSTFKPAQDDSELSLDRNCRKVETNVFFYIGKIGNNQNFQSVIAKDFFNFYFIETNLNTSPDQNKKLTFTFKLS